MKKLSFLLILALLPLMANAYDAEIEGLYYDLNSNTNQATVTSGDYQYSGSVTIPETITYNGVTYSVTEIGSMAFLMCSGLSSVKIGNNITSIGEYAFNNCTGLNSITVESGNPKYDSRDNCNAIIETYTNTLVTGCKNTTIPNSVTSIGRSAFGGCSNMTSVTIPNSVTSIGEKAFYNCSGLTSVTIPNSVTEVGDNAFTNTAWYRNQPDGLIYIGLVAYKYKGEMPENTSIAIKEGTTGIGKEAFYNCTGLTYISIPNSVTQVGNNAFNGTTWYDNLPDGLTYIGTVAYKYMGEMPKNTSITLKEGTTSIGYDAFSGCTGMTSVTIPNSVTSIGEGAFYDCSGLTSVTIPYSVTSINDFTFYGCLNLTEVTIPNSVTSIGGAAFWKCEKLTSVDIPNSVTSIGGQAFAECSSLTSVDIPNSVTSIGCQAFGKCYGLTSVIIPNSVTSIGGGAFYYCYSLTSVTIPNSVTSIGSQVFENCSGLTLVKIGSGVKSIGGRAFSYCSQLVNIYCFAEEVPTTESYAFYASPISSTTLYVPEVSAKDYQNTSPWSGFGTIVAFDDDPETKCATPTIEFSDGKLFFSCETEGVEFHYEYGNKGVGPDADMSQPVIVSVYASKEGYEDSDVVTEEIIISGGGRAVGIRGDVNKDGEIGMPDIMFLVQYLLNGKFPDEE